MSYCKAILVAFLSFWSSASLMGMNNAENHNYSKIDIPKLLWWSQHDVTDKYGKPVPKEIKDIIVQKGFDLHGPLTPLTKKYFRNPLDWVNLGNPDRISTYKGERIRINDFDLATIDDEGKNVFGSLVAAIPYKKNDDTFSHNYIGDSVGYTHSPTGPKIDEKHRLLSQDEYDKILKLPLALRRKVGELCTVKTVGRQHISFDDKWVRLKMMQAALGGALGGFVGAIGGGVYAGVQLGDWQAIQVLGAAMAAADSNSSYYNRRQAEKQLEELNATSEGMKALGTGACGGAILGAITLPLNLDDSYDKTFNVVEKPIITPKEKTFIHKAELETKIKAIDKVIDEPYNNELQDLQLHLTTMKEDWNNKSEVEKKLHREAFNTNHAAVEQEIESLKNHRMQFAHSNMKTSNFENLQSERNAAATEKTWIDLPWYKKLFYVGAPSDLNPDVKVFNKLQEKHTIRRAVNLQKQQQQKLNNE